MRCNVWEIAGHQSVRVLLHMAGQVELDVAGCKTGWGSYAQTPTGGFAIGDSESKRCGGDHHRVSKGQAGRICLEEF